MNQCVIDGTLGKDVELRYTNSGTTIASFSMANSELKFGGNFKKSDDYTTTWINVKAVGKVADTCRFSKGDRVVVIGKITQETWEKDGTKHYKSVLIASKVLIDKYKSEPANHDDQNDASPQSSVSDDDLPF